MREPIDSRPPTGSRMGPTPFARRRLLANGVLAGLAASAVCLALSPAALPAGYSWVSNTTSEAAAQGVEGAWLARLGLLLFGLSVIALAQHNRRTWGAWGGALHLTFGVLMLSAATFSTRSWESGAEFDAVEDVLHSIAATGMGFAFAAGVAVVSLRRKRMRALDVIAVAASVVLPLGMSAWGDADGVLQRVLFLIAYGWYGSETVRREESVPPVP